MLIPVHHIGGRHYDVERKASYTVGEILPSIDKNNLDARLNIDGDRVRCNIIRLKVFKKSGCKCSGCGLKGSFFVKEYDATNKLNRKSIEYNLRLYGVNKNGEVLMTVDYIIPKSKGGTDDMENLQTMCYVCNNKKKNKIPVVKTMLRLLIDEQWNKFHRILKRIKHTVLKFKNRIKTTIITKYNIKNKIKKKYNHLIYKYRIGIKVEEDGKFTRKHDWFWH